MVYYNNVQRRLIWDAFDLFLLSLFISSYITLLVKDRYFLSEEEKMERLAQDIISQSRANSELPVTSSSSISTKTRKIYNLARSFRGGDFNDKFLRDEVIKSAQENLEKGASVIQKAFERIISRLGTKVDNRGLALVQGVVRTYLSHVLSVARIQMFSYDNPLTAPIVVTSILVGTATGTVIAWYTACGYMLLHGSFAVFGGRFVIQQLGYNKAYRKTQHQIETIKTELDNLLEPFEKQLQDDNLKIKITDEHKSLTMQKAEEQLGIRNKHTGLVKSTKSPLYRRYQERLRQPIQMNDDLILSNDESVVDLSVDNVKKRIRELNSKN